MLLGALGAFGLGLLYRVDAQQPGPSTSCRITGRAVSGNVPLPGVSLVVRAGDTVKLATSTDLDGRFAIVFAPNGTYRLTAELPTFGRVEREVVTGQVPCDAVIDLQLALRSRTEPVAPPPGQAAANTNADGQANPAATAPASGAGGRGRGGRGGAGAQGRGNQPGRGFQTLTVEQDSNNTLVDAPADDADAADAALQQFLPSGFTLDSAQADAVAISGSNDAMSLDRA